MGLFDIFKKKAEPDSIDRSKQHETIETLGLKGYKQIHFEECKYIWKNWVPKKGQADSLQGEMLRQAECLRNEAMDNGNANWDDNFAWFCDFLKDTLTQSGVFGGEKNKKLEKTLAYVKTNGEYAKAYGEGKISDEEVDVVRLAYAEDDLYDYLEDAIAEFYLVHKDPIPYEKKDFIYR